MNHPWRLWLFFGLSLAIVLSAMGWISARAMKLEREAVLEENVRLALWRLDSSLQPLIIEESSRPYFTYTSFYPAERAYDQMFAPIGKGQVLVPSPLLVEQSPTLRVHFQFDPEGRISSPQIPTGNARDLAGKTYLDPTRIARFGESLAILGARLNRNTLLDLAPETDACPEIPVLPTIKPQDVQLDISSSYSSSREKIARSKNYKRVVEQQAMTQNAFNCTTLPASTSVLVGAMTPHWTGEFLLLIRRAQINGELYVQGCWLDWEKTRESLLEEVRDLLPEANLALVSQAAPGTDSHVLAGLPVELLPGSLTSAAESAALTSPLLLLVAWVCVLVAALAVAILLRGAMALSERRGDFVSAVTHELRTPLTTFQLYTELLRDNKVTDPEKRQSYLETLHLESGRLGHMVENVLGYARLEKGKSTSRLERVSVEGIIDKVRDRLTNRAEQASMELEISSEAAGEGTIARGDPNAIEQILLNLVDNACKYGKNGNGQNTIRLSATRRDGQLVFRVRDQGNGIAPELARRLFKPFSKSAREAAHSAPGVGLGLALSRRLARAMGGDLTLEENGSDGACFALTLSVDKGARTG